MMRGLVCDKIRLLSYDVVRPAANERGRHYRSRENRDHLYLKARYSNREYYLSDDENDSITRGDIIKKAIYQSDILADADVREIVIKKIEQDGVALNNEHYYSLKDIEKPLHDIFGPRLTWHILARLVQDIESLKSFVSVASSTAASALSGIAATCTCNLCEFISNCTAAMTMV